MKRATSSGTKNVKKTTVVTAPITDTAVATTVPAPVQKPVRKRESKKKFPVVAIVTPDGIEGNFLIEPRRPLIAHLPIRSTEVVFHDIPIHYDPNPPAEPDPFDQGYEVYQTTSETIKHQDTVFEAAPEHLQEDNGSANSGQEGQQPASESVAAAAATPPPAFAKAELLVSFKGSAQSQTIPDSTTVACFWCCHSFEGQPCVIPVREERGVYEVYGNFCCPECALAYILDERDDSHVKWEKISLLHRIYGPSVAPGGGRIYPAPARMTLGMFGGTLGIDAYRKTVREGKVRLDIHLPPMISILATMDTKPIDFYETTIPNSFVPLNGERVVKAEEGLRLKRSKPLKDRESTLDAVMNLQIRRVPIVNPFEVSVI